MKHPKQNNQNTAEANWYAKQETMRNATNGASATTFAKYNHLEY